jgi:hypothetical protein
MESLLIVSGFLWTAEEVVPVHWVFSGNPQAAAENLIFEIFFAVHIPPSGKAIVHGEATRKSKLG